jgi:hypothetical protein
MFKRVLACAVVAGFLMAGIPAMAAEKVSCCHKKGDCDKAHTKAECEKTGGKMVKDCKKDCK